jgi:hypothetical protein
VRQIFAACDAKLNIPDWTGELPTHAIFRGGGECPGTLPPEKHHLDALACILEVDMCGETDVNVPDPHEHNFPT